MFVKHVVKVGSLRIIHAFSSAFDTDGDGVISAEERKAAREQLWEGVVKKPKTKEGDGRGGRNGIGGKKGNPKDRWQRLIEQFDQDGDGKLSDSERQKAREWMAKRGLEADKMKKLVAMKFDSNGDGKITAEEWREIQAKVKAHEKLAREELVRKYDLDGDGKLSGKEKLLAHESEKRAMLEKYDLDNDGELSLEERKAAFGEMLENDPIRLLIQLRKQNAKHRGG